MAARIKKKHIPLRLAMAGLLSLHLVVAGGSCALAAGTTRNSAEWKKEIEAARQAVTDKYPDVSRTNLLFRQGGLTLRVEADSERNHFYHELKNFSFIDIGGIIRTNEGSAKVEIVGEFEVGTVAGISKYEASKATRVNVSGPQLAGSWSLMASNDLVIAKKGEASNALATLAPGKRLEPLTKVLQSFADISGEKILIKKHLIHNDSIGIFIDTAPANADEAIRLIIAALGAAHYELVPTGSGTSSLGMK